VIRVLIAARSAVVRAGLEALLASSPGISVTGSDPDLSGIEALRPDVVLAAFAPGELPSLNGDAPPAVVLLTNEAQPAWTGDAVRQGVRALLPRDAGAAEILAAVEAAARGLAVVDPRELETLLAGAVVAAPAASETPALTARELEVLRMLAEGAANKTIAWKLNISEHTAKFHVASILSKLNASTRTEAVTVGIRKGLILV